MVNGEQNEPMMDANSDGSPTAKKQGILVQVAADTAGRPHAEVISMLRQRLGDAGIPVDDEELRELAAALPVVDDQASAENRAARDAG